MKKVLTIIICTIVLVGCIPSNIYALDAEITPYYNNTQTTTTNFNIDNAGVATLKTFVNGYPNITTGATIKIKIQKRFLLVFWNDVASWTDEATGYYYSNTHSTTVEKGYYRAQVEYTIYGTGGSPDVITDEVERSY